MKAETGRRCNNSRGVARQSSRVRSCSKDGLFRPERRGKNPSGVQATRPKSPDSHPTTPCDPAAGTSTPPSGKKSINPRGDHGPARPGDVWGPSAVLSTRDGFKYLCSRRNITQGNSINKQGVFLKQVTPLALATAENRSGQCATTLFILLQSSWTQGGIFGHPHPPCFCFPKKHPRFGSALPVARRRVLWANGAWHDRRRICPDLKSRGRCKSTGLTLAALVFLVGLDKSQ